MHELNPTLETDALRLGREPTDSYDQTEDDLLW
jgi:hypothetical protein